MPSKAKKYFFHEIISDAFSYALSIDKIHLAFYLFWIYKDDVAKNKELCIDTIIQTFDKQRYKKVKAVPYLEERLFMMELLISTIQYDQALSFLKIIEELI